MQGAFLLRIGSRILSAIMGGMGVFDLYYAVQARFVALYRWSDMGRIGRGHCLLPR